MAYDEDLDEDDDTRAPKLERKKTPGRRRRGLKRVGDKRERVEVVESIIEQTLAFCAPVREGQIFAVRPGNGGAHTEETIEEALWKSAGKRSIAAQWLGMTREALYGRINNSQYLQGVITDIEELGLDIAELQLDALVATGSEKAIAFKLKTKGKHRGWAENKQPVNNNSITLEAAKELEGKFVSAFDAIRKMAVEAAVAQQAAQASAPLIEQAPAPEDDDAIADAGLANG